MLELAPLLVSALILGLLGGGHCLGMCGGLMGALTLAIPKEQRSRRFRLLLAYNLGRILSYATAGLLIGLAGWAVANSPAAMFMRVLAGLLLICMGLYLAGWWSGLTRIESLGRGLWRHLQPVANRLLENVATLGGTGRWTRNAYIGISVMIQFVWSAYSFIVRRTFNFPAVARSEKSVKRGWFINSRSSTGK